MRFILGSQSPRRRELLGALVGADNVDVIPPSDGDEAGFDGLVDWNAIEQQLAAIALGKFTDVSQQVVHQDAMQTSDRSKDVVITGDTVIVGIDDHSQCVVLGKPPAGDWKPEVGRWFRDYFIGATHYAATAVCVGRPGTAPLSAIVKTAVTFRSDVEHLVDWYLDTNESVGKAGGYAMQGAGSMFVQCIDGSLSNVVGLPLEATRDLIDQVLPV